MMQLPLTLPLGNHLPRKIGLSVRASWPNGIDTTPPAIRILEVQILSDEEEAALRTWLATWRHVGTF
jgi:hypothetical protein